MEVIDKEEAVEPAQQVTAASIEDPAQEADLQSPRCTSMQQVWSNNTSSQQQGAGADQSDEMESNNTSLINLQWTWCVTCSANTTSCSTVVIAMQC